MRLILGLGLLLVVGLMAPERSRTAPGKVEQTMSREPGYLSPAEAGFHHCALIYERSSRSAEDLLPYVCRMDRGRPREWLFDSFLFLRFNMPSGTRTDEGPTTWPDWLKHLDDWFADGRDLRALDEAIGTAAAKLGNPPVRRTVMLSIPYPNRAVLDFGLDEEGGSAGLNTDSGLENGARRYVAEASRRFAEAGYKHLDLWGFYWMREEISPPDEPRVRVVARAVHDAGFRLSWIPWWRASGWDRGRECGIDATIMQPNYAFVAWTHGGAVRRNRLAVAADLARANRLGIEIEAGDVVNSRADRAAFIHYLADGAPERLGYRDGASAYYLGVDTVERTCRSQEPEIRRLYDALADFVTGRPVSDPDPKQTWKSVCGGMEGVLHSPAHVTALDLFFDEPAGSEAWTGRVEVFGASRDGEPMRPAGWALRTRRQDQDGRHQVITVPIDRDVAALKVKLYPSAVRGAPNGVRALAGGVGPEGIRRHLAYGCAYTTDLSAKRAYDDDGAKLIDGVTPPEGFPAGRSVGWTAPEVAVRLDLGRVRRVTAIEVVCQGGSGSWVNWPTDAVATLSQGSAPPDRLSSTGPWPRDLRTAAPSPIVVTRRRSETDMDGLLRFEVKPSARARYANIVLRGNGWIMLSEVRVLDGARNVAREPGVRYALRPLPTPTEADADRYADDGVRLTDGYRAGSFSRTQVTGWNDGSERTFVVDLGMAQRISEATVWSLRGGQFGIYAPKTVICESSSDGHAWRRLGSADRAEGVEDGKSCEAAPYRIVGLAECRYLRIRVVPQQGWAMLSEIEVAGQPVEPS